MEDYDVNQGKMPSEADMQANHDASILAYAEEIMRDKKRLNAAYAKIEKMSEEAADKAAAMSALASKVERQKEKAA